MTLMRAIDGTGDWLFGKSLNDYVSGNPCVVQDIRTRLSEFLGDCFWNLGAGIDWFNLLGAKDQLALNLAVSAVILNTENVTGILQLSIGTNRSRNLTIKYQVSTVYSYASGIFNFSPTVG